MNLTSEQAAEQMVAYDLPLRRDLVVRLLLPMQLTPEDADRVAAFVHSLAWPETEGATA